mgnify:FL=1
MQIGGIGGSTGAFSAREQRRVTEESDGANLRDAAAKAADLQRRQVVEEAQQVERPRDPAKAPGLGTLVDRFA